MYGFSALDAASRGRKHDAPAISVPSPGGLRGSLKMSTRRQKSSTDYIRSGENRFTMCFFSLHLCAITINSGGFLTFFFFGQWESRKITRNSKGLKETTVRHGSYFKQLPRILFWSSERVTCPVNPGHFRRVSCD